MSGEPEPRRASNGVTGARSARRVRRIAAARRTAAAVGAAAALLAAAPPASAQLGRKSWELFPHVGAFLPSDPDALADEAVFDGFDPGVLWGVAWTYHYTDHVGVELGFTKATANGPESAEAEGAGIGDVGFDFWELNGFVNSGALNPVQVYALAGTGLVNFDPEDGHGPTRLLLSAGAGVRWYKWKNLALRAEVRDYVFPDAKRGDYTSLEGEPLGEGETVHNPAVFAGLSINF